MMTHSRGFSLVELIAVMVIVGVLAVVVAGRIALSPTQQLQASRDSIVAALFAAQQLAMVHGGGVQVITGGDQVDVQREVSPGNYQSVRMGNVQYPLMLESGQSVSTHTLNYNNSLGRTDPANITLAQDGNIITIELSASGFSH